LISIIKSTNSSSRPPKSLGGFAFIILVFKNNTFFLNFIMCVLYFMNVSGRLLYTCYNGFSNVIVWQSPKLFISRLLMIMYDIKDDYNIIMIITTRLMRVLWETRFEGCMRFLRRRQRINSSVSNQKLRSLHRYFSIATLL